MLYSCLYYTIPLYLIQYISEHSKGPYIPIVKTRGFMGLSDKNGEVQKVACKQSFLYLSIFTLLNVMRKMGLELDSAFGNRIERSFFAPHFDLETFWKHHRVCLNGMLYFIDGELPKGYNL